MPRIGEQITQNGRIMEWQGDMWIDIGEANIPPGVRVGSVADLRPGIDFPFPQGPNVEWEKFYGPYDQPMMRGKYLDPYNPDLGAMYASSRLNPDTMQYGPLTQSEKPVTSYYASGDPTTHQERLQNRIDAMPKGSIRDRQNAMNRDLDNINLPKQQTPFSVRRDVGPELAKDGGYKMDDPNIANLSYFNPEEEILERARVNIQNIINNAFGTEKRAGPDTHAELARTINRIADTAGLPDTEIMQFQRSLTENYAANLEATKDQVSATAIDVTDETGEEQGGQEDFFLSSDEVLSEEENLKKWLNDAFGKNFGKDFFHEEEDLMKKQFNKIDDDDDDDEESQEQKKKEIEEKVKELITRYGNISLHQLETMAEDGQLPPIPKSLFYALANPTIKVERQVENPAYDPLNVDEDGIPIEPMFLTTVDEIANPILEPIFNVYASQLDSQVEAFRLKKADDMSAAENASRINQALISATGGLAGRDDEDFTQEQLAKQEESLARIAATGGLEGLSAKDYETYLTNKSLIAATGGLRGGDEGLSADELAEKQKAQQQISATGGLSGFTPFSDAAMADFAAPIQSQLFGTQDGSVATTRSLTPFELAQLQLEPERIRAANEAAQRAQLASQFERDLALRQQEMDARYGNTDAIGLEQGRLNLETRRQQEAESARVFDEQMRNREADMVRAQIAEDNRRQLEDERMRNLNYQAQFGGIGTMGLDVRRQQEAEAARQFAQQQQLADAVEQQRRFNEQLAINQRAQELSENQLAQQRSLELANLYADPNRVGALSALYGPDIFQTQNPFGAPTTSPTTQSTGMSQNLGYTPFGSSTLTTGHFQDLSPFAQSSYLTTQARQRGKSVEELMDEMQSVTPMGTNGGAGGLGGSLASTGELY